MTDEALYRLRDLQKSYGANFTLHVRQLDVRRGEVLGLLGPTGAGKSTLLRLLAGLENPTGGEIRFDDSPFVSTDLPLPTRRRMTLVHQRPVLLTGSVWLNVEYGLRLRGIRNQDRKVHEMLERLGLVKIASQSAHTLSGGQTQLVALARALVIEPDVLLLDEPAAHLDPAHVAVVEETIRQFQQERRTTIVWATHNLFQARRVAVRTALLLNGQLVEVAPTEEFFANPSDRRTADFLQGRMVY
ncbi:MAG: phosphate ABC transporter ATP-binding protein [Planctomycetes bacterium]|nr:phosphate ABC transporter ATP-binding protein [Planctomycetota bacterium]